MSTVEEALSDTTDAQLIGELRRRGRLRVAGTTAVWYNDLAEDDKYMEAMRREQIAKLAEFLDNELCIRYRERVIARDHFDRPVRTARYASVLVLVPEGE